MESVSLSLSLCHASLPDEVTVGCGLWKRFGRGFCSASVVGGQHRAREKLRYSSCGVGVTKNADSRTTLAENTDSQKSEATESLRSELRMH